MKLDDQTLLDVALELRTRNPRVGIASLRSALQARFGGYSAGTDRLSRILKRARTPSRAVASVPSPQTPAGVVVARSRYPRARKAWWRLRQRLKEAQDRAARAEEGERNATCYWAMKVDGLRQQILELSGRDTGTPSPGSPRWLDLTREVQSARLRISALETQLAQYTAGDPPPK